MRAGGGYKGEGGSKGREVGGMRRKVERNGERDGNEELDALIARLYDEAGIFLV